MRRFPRMVNGTFTAENASLKTLLVVAYGFNTLRIEAPARLSDESYDITAKAPAGTPDDKLMPLLQSLLKDRFHLQSHFETKETAVYDMIVARSGAKLTAFDSAKPPQPPENRGQSVLMGVELPSNSLTRLL